MGGQHTSASKKKSAAKEKSAAANGGAAGPSSLSDEDMQQQRPTGALGRAAISLLLIQDEVARDKHFNSNTLLRQGKELSLTTASDVLMLIRQPGQRVRSFCSDGNVEATFRRLYSEQDPVEFLGNAIKDLEIIRRELEKKQQAPGGNKKKQEDMAKAAAAAAADEARSSPGPPPQAQLEAARPERNAEIALGLILAIADCEHQRAVLKEELERLQASLPTTNGKHYRLPKITMPPL